MRVYKISTNRRVKKYVGAWYDGQCLPQPVNLSVNPIEGCLIDYNGNIGGGCSPDVFHNREICIKLPFDVYSESDCKYILKSIKPLTDKLIASYSEDYDGNNYIGHWNETLVSELERELLEFETSLSFEEG